MGCAGLRNGYPSNHAFELLILWQIAAVVLFRVGKYEIIVEGFSKSHLESGRMIIIGYLHFFGARISETNA